MNRNAYNIPPAIAKRNNEKIACPHFDDRLSLSNITAPYAISLNFPLCLPKILFALALIFAALEAESLPFFTIWVALPLALAALPRVSIGYFRWLGSPNLEAGIDLRA